jgi:P27 family predicted phage terminase small subunit
MAGRRPKPTQLKILEGNRGHRRIVGDDFQPEPGVPEMPKGLSRAARREFRFMSRVLLDRGLLTIVDGKALAAYCQAYAFAEVALRDIEKHGQPVNVLALDKKTGKPVVKCRVRNPAIGTYRQMSRLMKLFLTEFGLTPASRRNLKASLN